MSRRRIAKEPRRYWSAEDLERLRELYPKHRTAEVAQQLGRSLEATHGMAQKLGIKGTPFRATVIPNGEKYRFKKGHVPKNKGLRRPGRRAPRAYGELPRVGRSLSVPGMPIDC